MPDGRRKRIAMNTHDRESLRNLAKQYAEICARPVQDERRALWRRHNSLKQTRPLIYVRAFAWKEMPRATCVCEDPVPHPVDPDARPAGLSRLPCRHYA